MGMCPGRYSAVNSTNAIPRIPKQVHNVHSILFAITSHLNAYTTLAVMADLSHATDGPSPLSQEGYDTSLLPDYDHDFVSEEDLAAFALALAAPDPSPLADDSLSVSHTSLVDTKVNGLRTSLDSVRHRPSTEGAGSLFITAQHDWAPVNQKIKGRKGAKPRRKKTPRRSKDETREGYLYTLLKWPLLAVVSAWVAGLGISYMMTRIYIWLYEHFVAWRGRRESIRQKLQGTTNYGDWVAAAKELDAFLGNDKWRAEDEYAYYDSKTVRRVLDNIRKYRVRAEVEEKQMDAGRSSGVNGKSTKPIEELKALIEASVKNNFVGVENARLYSQTYYGTKILVQEFIDEGKYIDSDQESFMRPMAWYFGLMESIYFG